MTFPLKTIGMLKSKVDKTFKFSIVTTGVDETFTLPTVNGVNYNAIVNYGDGGGDKEITAYNDPDIINTYAIAGTYQISISGKFGALFFNNVGDKLKVVSVDQWGNVGFDTADSMFYGCSNLTLLPTKGSLKGTSSMTSAASMLRNTQVIIIPGETLSECPQVTTIAGFSSTNFALTTVEDGLFDNLPLVTNADGAFFANILLATIPSDLLHNMPLLTDVNNILRNCFPLSTIAEDFFYHNKLITNYADALHGLRAISALPARIWDTSVLNIVTSFDRVLDVTNTIYSPTGNIQDIWNYTSATSVDAFLNQTGFTNYASIPNNWKGL